MTLALALSLALVSGAAKKVTIDGAEVAKVIAAHMAHVRGCFEKSEREKPTTGGKVILEAVINPSGDVVDAGIKNDSMKSETFNTCLVEQVKTWKFPPARGGNATITYPFGFSGTKRVDATQTYNDCMKTKKNQVECISEVENIR
jgi:TonB family protein